MDRFVESCRGKAVVLSGCGGGADVYGTALLLHGLQRVARKTVLVSLSFTHETMLNQFASTTPDVVRRTLGRRLYFVQPNEGLATALLEKKDYFPEALMAARIGHGVYIIVLPDLTIGGIKDCYRAIYEAESLGPPVASAVEGGGGGAGGVGGAVGAMLASISSTVGRWWVTERPQDDGEQNEDGTVGGGAEGAAPSPPPAVVLCLVDGGCDVLLTGLEEGGLATPVEDMMHLRATRDLCRYQQPGGPPPPTPTAAAEGPSAVSPSSNTRHHLFDESYVFAIGANVDCGHGVLPHVLDRRLAAITSSSSPSGDHDDEGASGGSGGDDSPNHKVEKDVVPLQALLTLSVPSAAWYYDMVMNCQPVCTNVQSFVCAALEGHRGFYTPPVLKDRIKESKIELRDQTATLYGFSHERIAGDVRYLSLLDDRMDCGRVSRAISAFRRSIGMR